MTGKTDERMQIVDARLAKAEEALGRLINNESYPLLKNYLLGHKGDCRVIVDSFPFRDEVDESSVEPEMLKATKGTGYIRPTIDEGGTSHFTLFYEPNISEVDRDMLARTYRAVLEGTLSAITSFSNDTE